MAGPEDRTRDLLNTSRTAHPTDIADTLLSNIRQGYQNLPALSPLFQKTASSTHHDFLKTMYPSVFYNDSSTETHLLTIFSILLYFRDQTAKRQKGCTWEPWHLERGLLQAGYQEMAKRDFGLFGEQLHAIVGICED